MNIYKRTLLIAAIAAPIVALWIWHVRSVNRARAQEVCRQIICDKDQLPEYDRTSYTLFKIDSKYYIAPKAYGGFEGKLTFFWPSGAPSDRFDLAPEFHPSASTPGNFDAVAIQLFLESPNPGNGVRLVSLNYGLIRNAIVNGWVEDKREVAPGLDQYTMKHIQGPDGYLIDHLQYYVANRLKGFDDMPPVMACNHSREDSTGGASFYWNGILVAVRMNQKHCISWAQIYPEISKILGQVREIR